MSEEKKNTTGEPVVDTKVVDGTDANLVDALAKLKQNSVSKEEYEKVVQKNKEIIDKVVNGGNLEDEKSVNPALTEEQDNELRKQLFSGDLNNLEYATAALKLRASIIAKGGEDPFLPKGHETTATEADREAANLVAEEMQKAVDYAKGDSQLFTQEMQRKTRDSNPRARNPFQ